MAVLCAAAHNTYLHTGQGWLYLATVIDLATRMVVGWQMAPHMRTSLVTDALHTTMDAGYVAPEPSFTAIMPSLR